MLSEIKVGPDIATINCGRSFMVSGLDGGIRRTAGHGLFTRDVRFLSHYRYRINGRTWKLVSSTPLTYTAARFEFTNPPLLRAGGPVPKHVLGLTVKRTVSEGVHEDFDLVNYHGEPVHLTFEIELGTDFADLFEVRSHYVRVPRSVRALWDERNQQFSCEYTRDTHTARFHYRFIGTPSHARRRDHALLFDLVLNPGERWHACAHLTPELNGVAYPAPPACSQAAVIEREGFVRRWRDAFADVRAGNDALTHTLARSADDLVSLLLDVQAPGEPCVLSAGVPWFVALFGRDALISGFQTLPLYHGFAVGALGVLGAYQATSSDDFRDADPGKILHELRTGELARFGQIPHTPYYGSADATILYPILLHETYMWTGSRELLATYLPVAERCMHWIDRYGDRDEDGFQEYRTRSPRGIKHQGWKDSSDGTMYADGQPVEPPVALCELQGYVYDAKQRMAALYDALGRGVDAGRLREEAEGLWTRFNEAFWLEDEGTYAFGLDSRKAPITSIVSNAGHCLWSGIAPPDRARRVIARLMANDMWSGWGIRTLSAAHPSFNPFAYQRGAVWPHDNLLIAAGCRRYGDADTAARITRGIIDAAAVFQRYRLPELLGGQARNSLGFPVQYLGANIPQAWAAASAFAFVQVLLGLRADAPHHRLYVAPALPAWLDWVEVRNLRVGASRVTLRCWREAERSRMAVQEAVGPIHVVETETWGLPPGG
jgi:glycogen debranching enzyme